MKIAHTLDATWNVDVGETFGVFHALLREGRIGALRCGGCATIYLPPRPVCGDCFAPLSEWVEVGQAGIVDGCTIVHHAIVDPITGDRRKTPAGLVLVQLDGATTPIQGWIVASETPDDGDLAWLAIGERVRMVWNEPRRTMADFAGFARTEARSDARFPRPIAPIPEPVRERITVRIPLLFRYDAGRANERFLAGLAEQRILASRCDRCALTLVPCRGFCPRCYGALGPGAEREVGPSGLIVAAAGSGAHASCLVRLDGADNALLHRLLDDARVGDRVCLTFADHPTGGLLDAVGFAS